MQKVDLKYLTGYPINDDDSLLSVFFFFNCAWALPITFFKKNQIDVLKLINADQ
jgi:hypothetical protein